MLRVFEMNIVVVPKSALKYIEISLIFNLHCCLHYSEFCKDGLMMGD